MNQRPVHVVEGAGRRGGTARAVARIGAALAAFTAPAGVTWTIAGADLEQHRTMREAWRGGHLSWRSCSWCCAGGFGSFTTPLLVMLTVPLAGVGGIVVLWLTGQSLNAVSLIGMVVMIGLADNDAVVKLDAIRRFRAAVPGPPGRTAGRPPAAPGHRHDLADHHCGRAAAGVRWGSGGSCTSRSPPASSAARSPPRW
ncbi:MAG: efflux RND transporter permease subunit [Gemmatimonadetes bacterium]|nr:efflux RND transporter permease subunit [Gemmatimonadota bacterium]